MKLKQLLTKTLLVAVCLLMGGVSSAWAEEASLNALSGTTTFNTSYHWGDQYAKNKVQYNEANTIMMWSNGMALNVDTSTGYVNSNSGLAIGNSSKKSAFVFKVSSASDISISLAYNNSEMTASLYYLGESTDVLTNPDNMSPTGALSSVEISSSNTLQTLSKSGCSAGYYMVFGTLRFIVKSITITSSANPPGAISFSPVAGSVAAGTSVTLTSSGATTIEYQWGASAVDGNGDWSSATTYSDSSKPIVPAAGSTNTVLSVKATNANGSTYGSASYTPVKMALKTIYSFADGIGGQAVEVADASVETSQMSLKNTNGRIKLTAATGFEFKNGDAIEFSGSIGNSSKVYGIKYGSTTSLGTNLFVAAGEPCHVSGTLTLASETSNLYIGRYDGTTTNFTTFTIRQLTAATSEAFSEVKLNGEAATEDVDYTKEGNVITLTADYTEAPTVYLVNHIVFTDESTEDQNVLVAFGNPDGTYFTGTAVIGGTTYTVKAPCGQINALKVEYKYDDTTVKEDLLDVTGLKVGASYTVPFRMYVEKDGALYQTTKNSSNPWYGDAVTLAYNTTVTKTVSSVDLGGGILVLFEDLDGDASQNADIRASNCSAYNNTAYTSASNLPAGKYTFIVKAMNKGRGSSVKVGETTVFTISDVISSNNSWTDKTFTDVIVPADGKLSLVAGGSKTYDCYDILIAIRTGDATVSGTITPAGWSTFASSYPLDLSTLTATSEATAYYASAATGSTVTLTPTTATVPAGEGIMVQGTAGETFTIAVAESGTAIDGNLLKGQTTTGNVAASTDGTYHYVFGYQTSDTSVYGFYNLASDTEVAAGKAYLETTTALTAGARSLSIVFDNETTGIENLTPALSEGKGVVYNLRGQRVAQPTKGLYIVNGKKVIIK